MSAQHVFEPVFAQARAVLEKPRRRDLRLKTFLSSRGRQLARARANRVCVSPATSGSKKAASVDAAPAHAPRERGTKNVDLDPLDEAAFHRGDPHAGGTLEQIRVTHLLVQVSPLSVLALGFALGVRHATDADHIVAVSTLVARTRCLRAAGAIGLLWGVGHSASILLVGGAIVLFGIVIPPHVGLGMELSVAVMLMVLGAASVVGSLRELRSAASRPSPPARSNGTPVVRPIVVGAVHGLAGSAAVALLVLATLHDAAWAVLYLGVFALGTITGMVALTLFFAAPIVAGASRFTRLRAPLARSAGIMSVVLGLMMAYRICVHDGLFTALPEWSPR